MSIHLNKLAGLVLLCLAFFSSGLVAQDFSAQNSKYTPAIYGDKFTYEEDKFYYFNELAGVLFLKGSIEKGMYKDFRQAITDNNIHTLVLDSPGGSVLEGVAIAETVFDRKIKTYIRKNQICASACAFIFLSGETRYSLGELGVHQISYGDAFSKTKEEVGKIAEAVQTANSAIVQVLEENNTPGFVYKYMFRKTADEMYYFNDDELNQLGNSDVSPQDKLFFNRIDNFSKDYNSHLIKQKCDTDPNSCTSAQLCSRAAKDNMWRTSLDAAKFVKLAKSKGNRCGVPVPVCPEDIKKCNQEYLCTYGTTGLDASLSWLNNSFADEAKLRGYSCGIIKPILETKPKPKKSCYTDHRLCSYEELCSIATITVNGKKDWTKISNLKEHVKLAKKTSFYCGVEKPNKIIEKAKCSEDPSLCSKGSLCNYAATYYTKDGPIWNENPYWAKHVSEAKRRGLSCGVKMQPEIRKPKTKDNIDKKTKYCSQEARNCTTKQLCARGTRIVNSNFLWQTNKNFEKYVSEAKRRGLTCGVKKTKQKTRKFFTTNGKTNVFYIQSYLNKLGCQAGKPDGLLSQSTIDALTRWEEYGGKYPIEKLDMNLRTHLKNSNISCGKLKTVKNQKNVTIKKIQTNLNQLGCNAGNADGILGRKTLSALQRWKSANGNKTININDISEEPSKILAVLKVTSLKCEKTKRFPSVAGTWKISYNNCNKNIKNPYLHLSVISSKKLYESFLHTDYQRLHLTGKLNIQDRNFKLKLNGKTGRLLTKSEEILVTGTFNEDLNTINGTDQNGCIFKGTKLDQNTYFDGTGITRKK